MKIALITIHNANNYGAILQTFATYKILSRLGDVDIIDYENRHISISLDLVRLKFTIHGILGMGKDIFRLIPRYKAIKKFRTFSEKYFKMSKKINKDDIDFPNYDLYVCGSDQIWNPNCISDNSQIDEIYFLNFAPKDSKKISYASSLGNYRFTIEEQNKVSNLLNDFSFLSVREKDGKEHLESFLNKEIKHVLDPTLLLSKKEWIETFDLKENISDEKYILVYSVPKSKLIKDAIEYFSKKLNLAVIALDQNLSMGTKVDKHIRDAGPIEYLNLFLNASFIITDSFHGTCFSVNFQKQFVSIAPGIHSNRIESFLNTINLENRIIRNKDNFENIEEIGNKEYDESLNLLNNFRDESIKYLERIC
ncbi:MAG: polysaccharide pyruvyl transferase family protein [Arcobacter sp.]|uniref:polysaccharide pyruvyl transferase family protein n=1 Tax=Arcobacter sp. TaxID=1872629 RepID=UPI003CFD2BB4